MIKALTDGFRRYADFSGRTTRAYFWNFVVATHLLIILCALPAIVEFMKFWRFALEDVRLMDTILQANTSAETQEAMVTVLTELATEYFANGLPMVAIGGLVLSGILAIVCLLPTISITVRRLRDAGVSPWWVLPPVCCVVPVPLLATLAQILCLVTLVLCSLPTRNELPAVPPQN